MKGGPRKTVTSLQVIVQMWPTPSTSDTTGPGTHRRAQTGGAQQTLTRQVKGTWATPSARDRKSDGPTQSPDHSPPLGRQVLRTPKAGDAGSPMADLLQLDPEFVEALMGLPRGWTDCARWATPSCQLKPRSRGAC